MKPPIFITAALLLFGCFGFSTSLWGQSAESDTSTTPARYGEWDYTIAASAVGVSSAMNDSTMHGKDVIVQGEILDVCRKKGCWIVVSDGTSQMRVTFKDYGFFVPTDSDGKTVRLQGVVSVEEIPEDMAKHYAEESKLEDPEAITGAQKVITMVASGVQIEEKQAK